WWWRKSLGTDVARALAGFSLPGREFPETLAAIGRTRNRLLTRAARKCNPPLPSRDREVRERSTSRTRFLPPETFPAGTVRCSLLDPTRRDESRCRNLTAAPHIGPSQLPTNPKLRTPRFWNLRRVRLSPTSQNNF